MAQNGSHGHQDGAASDDGHSTPPTPVTFSLTSAGPYGYGNGGSSADNMDTMDAGVKGKNLIPDLNMMERDSMGGSKDKPRSEAGVQEEVAAADADADDGELNLYVNLILERAERRKRIMKDRFRSLRAVLPHVPRKTDKATLIGETIRYIRFLEHKAAILWADDARGEASSSSYPFTAMPQITQEMAALSSDVPRGWGDVPVPPTPTFLGLPIWFKRWSGPNFFLAVANDKAYIHVRVPQRSNTLITVLSLLDSHGIDVISAQISSDSVSSLFLLFAQVTGIDGANRSSEEVFQNVVSEIMLNN